MIRFPFVRRVELERAVSAAAHERDNAQALRREVQQLNAQAYKWEALYSDALKREALADQRYETLLARYHMLKLQGANEAAPAPPPREPKERDAAIAAINAKCGTNRRLRSQMMTQLNEDRRLKVSEEEILRRIDGGLTLAPDTGSLV